MDLVGGRGDTIPLLKRLLLYCEYSLNGNFKCLFKLPLYYDMQKIETKDSKVSRGRSGNLHLSRIMLGNTGLYENKLPFFLSSLKSLHFPMIE